MRHIIIRKYAVKSISLILTAVFAVNTFSVIPVFADKNMTLSQAVNLAIKNSKAVKNVGLKAAKKKIELKQANATIKQTRRNESTVRYSLLFKLRFPGSHDLPKEVDLLTKIPILWSEIRILERERVNAQRIVKNKCETAYYAVIHAQYLIDYNTQCLEEAKTAAKTVGSNFASGSAKKADVEYIEKQVTTFEKDLTAAKANFEKAKKKLTDITGVNVNTGYTFTATLPDVTVNRSEMNAIKTFAEKNDYGFYKASEEKNAAQSSNNIIKSLYSSSYRGYSSAILAYINNCNRTGQSINYEVFLGLYERFLTGIQSPWAGSYTIRMIFFKIHIPKEWFKRTYSGERYLGDELYLLFVNLAELDEKIGEYENVKKELASSVESAYDAFVSAQNSVKSTKADLVLMKSDYTAAVLDNAKGLLAYTELYDKKLALKAQEKSIYESQIGLAESISTFDLQTSGYVTNKLNSSSAIQDNYEDGITFGDDSDEPQWYIYVSMAENKFAFGVKLPSEFDVTHFRLFTDAGKAIGAITDIKSELAHLSVSYADTSLLTIKFYKNNQVKYTATFDGLQYSGTLNMQPADGSGTDGFIAGAWGLTETGLKSAFKIDCEEFTYNKFELYYNDILIGTAENGKSIDHLTSTFAKTQGFTVKLYNGDDLMATLKVMQNNAGDKHLTL